MIALIAAVYRKLIQIGFYIAPIALLLLRLGWGWELAQSGYGHLTHINDTAKFFHSLDIPQPKASAIISGTTELVGGGLLILGLGARAIAVPLIFNFCTAYFTASHDTVIHFFKQDPAKFVDDTAYPFLITSILMLAFGAGPISIDGILKRTVFKRYAAGLPAR